MPTILGTTLLGGRSSANTAIAAVADLMEAQGYIVSSETPSTSWGALACDALGEVGTAQVFRAVAGDAFLFSGRLLLRVPWTLTTQTATAAARATLRAKLLLNGTEVASVDGAPRNINSANGTQFTELLGLTVTTPTVVFAGGTIDIQIVPLITVVAAAAQTYVPTLRHNPQAVDDQLVAEFGGAW